MTPLPLYLPATQAILQEGFAQIRKEIALHAGWGADPSAWTADETTELGNDVVETMRWVLYPETVADDMTPHQWSFLKPTTTITLTAGTGDYTLPVDFGSFAEPYMFFAADSGRDRFVRQTIDTDILHRRQRNVYSARPQMFAPRWLPYSSGGTTQRQQVLFYPNPDANYVLTYKYNVYVGGISETSPYPPGGPLVAQLMIEFGRAIGQAKKNNGQRTDQWNIAMMRLRSAIQMDKAVNTPRSLGRMRGSYGSAGYGYRPDPERGRYFFGPDTAYGPSLYQEEVT